MGANGAKETQRIKTSNSRSAYDAVIIGGGHNGLVAAAYLAKEGRRVLLLERRPVLGGAAATEEVFSGFRVNTGAGDAGLFLPQIVTDLQLQNYGLEFIESPVVALALQPDGPPLTLWRHPERAAEEIARFSEADARRYPAFLSETTRYARILDSMRTLAPPSLPKYRYGELLSWLPAGINLRRLGKRQMMAFLRMLPMPVTDFLDEWFETPLLKAALGFSGVAGSMQGPRASGTAFMFLYHAQGGREGIFRASRFVRGGSGNLSDAIASAARQHGAEICVGSGVAQILVDGDRAAGVVLEDGRQMAGRVVISGADPRHTFFDLVGPAHLEVGFVREVKNIKFSGSTARVNLALSGLPDFAGLARTIGRDALPALLSGHILLCPHLDVLERAYDDAKYGRFSNRPCLDILIPTILDASLAPPDHHLMSIDVRYAPYHLKEGDWEVQREALGNRVVETLEVYAPNIRKLIMHRQVLTPLDYECQYGLPEGSIFHGQMGLDQLFIMRPVPGYARYRSPIENLYLCGSGAHPGGGVTGAPGYNAARAVLNDAKVT